MSPARLEYFLWPHENLADLYDEFVVRGCRVWLRGGLLTVEATFEAADTTVVLQDYVRAFRNRFGYFRLLTVDEVGALPPTAIATSERSARETSIRRAHLRAARQEIVAPAHPRLSQCYDDFQSAVDEREHALIHLFKMVESTETEYGGENEAKEALGVTEPMKTLKGLGTGTPLTDADWSRAIEAGRAILEAFEQDVLRNSSFVK